MATRVVLIRHGDGPDDDRRQHDWFMGFLERIFAGVRPGTAAGEEAVVSGVMEARGLPKGIA